ARLLAIIELLVDLIDGRNVRNGWVPRRQLAVRSHVAAGHQRDDLAGGDLVSNLRHVDGCKLEIEVGLAAIEGQPDWSASREAEHCPDVEIEHLEGEKRGQIARSRGDATIDQLGFRLLEILDRFD